MWIPALGWIIFGLSGSSMCLIKSTNGPGEEGGEKEGGGEEGGREREEGGREGEEGGGGERRGRRGRKKGEKGEERKEGEGQGKGEDERRKGKREMLAKKERREREEKGKKRRGRRREGGKMNEEKGEGNFTKLYTESLAASINKTTSPIPNTTSIEYGNSTTPGHYSQTVVHVTVVMFPVILYTQDMYLTINNFNKKSLQRK